MTTPTHPTLGQRLTGLAASVAVLGIVLGLPSLSVHNQFSSGFGGLKHQYGGKLCIHLGYVPSGCIHRYDIAVNRGSCAGPVHAEASLSVLLALRTRRGNDGTVHVRLEHEANPVSHIAPSKLENGRDGWLEFGGSGKVGLGVVHGIGQIYPER